MVHDTVVTVRDEQQGLIKVGLSLRRPARLKLCDALAVQHSEPGISRDKLGVWKMVNGEHN